MGVQVMVEQKSEKGTKKKEEKKEKKEKKRKRGKKGKEMKRKVKHTAKAYQPHYGELVRGIEEPPRGADEPVKPRDVVLLGREVGGP